MQNNIHTININAYPNNYNIYIGNSLGNNDLLNKYIIKNSKVIVVYDSNLNNTLLPLLLNSLNKIKVEYHCFSFTSTEQNKSFTNIHTLVNKILDLNINRTSTIISLGGGITSDVCGFISAILLRGINLINIPTTLLSAVDSSIGGKNGVNHNKGKNLIGTFYNPKAVIIDPIVFNTLSSREMLSGFAEVIKCSLISDESFFSFLSTNYNLLLKNEFKFLQTIIEESILIKKNLVEGDYFDTNKKRVLLNLGHTFGHALELINDYNTSLTHGEAVAIGLCMAAKFSNHMNLLNSKKTNEIINIIDKVNLPIEFPKLQNNSILQTNLVMAMLKDKKNTSQNINLVLLKDIGKALLVENIPINKITNFINSEYN